MTTRTFYTPAVPVAPRRLLPGRWYSAGGQAVATFAQVAGQSWITPIYLVQATTIAELAVDVTAAAASSTITIGLYGCDDYDQPAGRLYVSPARDASTTGFKKLVGPMPLSAGWYWVAALALGGTPTLRCVTNTNPLVTTASETSATGANGYLAAGLSDLPATWTSTTAAGASPRVLYKA